MKKKSLTAQNLEKIDILISSPSDLGDERRVALKAIDRLSTTSHMVDRFVLRPAEFERDTPAAVGHSAQHAVNRYTIRPDKCDILVCMLWQRMGTEFVDEETGRRYASGTEYEFLTAYDALQKTGKPHILLYRKKTGTTKEGETAQLAMVDAFFRGFHGKEPRFVGLYQEFESTEDFERRLFHDLDKLIAREFAPGDASPSALTNHSKRSDFYHHISLPVIYTQRRQLVEEAAATLLDEPSASGHSSSPSRVFVALHGMGGIGKSVTARAICDLARVQAAFDDGILWVSLGKEPDISTRLREWIRVLKGEITDTKETLDALKGMLAKLLGERACLLVVDDVWRKNDLAFFDVGGPQCRLLFTTRDAEIAKEFGAYVHPVPTMSSEEAVCMLRSWAGETLAPAPPELTAGIAQKVGYLPLAIRLVGAQLRRKDPRNWLAAFDATTLKSTRPEAVHDSLEATFELSLEELSEKEQRLYAALAIFLQEDPTPLNAVGHLWSGLGYQVERTKELAEDLEARALLELVNIDSTRGVRLHGLLSDLMRARLGKEGMRSAHKALLASYRGDRDQWHTMPDDGYIHNHLIWHMDKAGLTHEVHRLLQEQTVEGDNAWYEVRQRQNQIAGYVADIERAFDLSRTDPDEISWLHEFRYAFSKCTLKSLSVNLPAELITALGEEGLWPPEKAVFHAARSDMPDFTLPLLAESMAGRGKIGTLYRAARGIDEDLQRASALVQIAPFLPDEEQSRALEQALDALASVSFEDADDAWPIYVLSCASIQLPQAKRDTLIGRRLAEWLKGRLAYFCDYTVVSLLREAIEDLDIEALRHLLAASGRLRSQRHCTLLIHALGPVVQELLYPDMRRVVGMIRSETERAAACLALPQQSKRERSQAGHQVLELLPRIRDDSRKAWLFINALPFLSARDRDAARQMALQIKDGDQQVRALAALAVHVGPPERRQILREAYECANTSMAPGEWESVRPAFTEECSARDLLLVLCACIKDDLTRNVAQSQVVDLLPEDEFAEAFATVSELRPNNRLHVVQCLLGRASDSQLKHVVKLLSALDNADYSGWEGLRDQDHSEILVAVVPRLSKREIAQMVPVARGIQTPAERSSALAALASCSPERDVPKLLGAIRELPDGIDRAVALVHAASRLSEPDRRDVLWEALRTSERIDDSGQQALTLLSLMQSAAPRLREEIISHVLERLPHIQNVEEKVEVCTLSLPWMEGARQSELVSEVIRHAHEPAPLDGMDQDYWVARALSGVLPFVSDGERRRLLKESLQAAEAVDWELWEESGLERLAPFLEPDIAWKALQIWQPLEFFRGDARTLVALIDRLRPKENASAAFLLLKNAVEAGTSPHYLIDALPGDLFPEVLTSVRSIGDHVARAQHESCLMPRLPSEAAAAVAGDILDAALSMRRKQMVPSDLSPEGVKCLRVCMLGSVLPYLSNDQRSDAEKAARKILASIDSRFDVFPARAYCALAVHLPDLIPQALEVVWAIEWEKDVSTNSAIDQLNLLASCSGMLPQHDKEPFLEKAIMRVLGKPRSSAALEMLLAELTPALRELTAQDLRTLWHHVLPAVSLLGREYALTFVRALSTTLRSQDQDLLGALVHAIRDTATWWP